METFADLNVYGKRALRKDKVQSTLVDCLFYGPGFGISKAPFSHSHISERQVWFGGQLYIGRSKSSQDSQMFIFSFPSIHSI